MKLGYIHQDSQVSHPISQPKLGRVVKLVNLKVYANELSFNYLMARETCECRFATFLKNKENNMIFFYSKYLENPFFFFL